MSQSPQTNGQPGSNGSQWSQQSFGPWKYLVSTTAALLVFLGFGWQLYTARLDALAAQEICRTHLLELQRELNALREELRRHK